MKKLNNKGLMRRIISVVMLPLFTLFWMTGWILFWIDSQKTVPIKTQKKQIILQETTLTAKPEQKTIRPQILASINEDF